MPSCDKHCEIIERWGIQCINWLYFYVCITDDLWLVLLSVLLIGDVCCILQPILKKVNLNICVEFTWNA